MHSLTSEKDGYTLQLLRQQENTGEIATGTRTYPYRGHDPEECVVVSNEFRGICGYLFHESIQETAQRNYE